MTTYKGLSENDYRLLALVMQCAKGPLDVDLARLAELANLGSIDEARTQWDQLRQRIDDYVDPAPRKEKKGKGKKKGKKGGDSDSDEEEQEDKNDSPGDALGGPSKGNGKGDGKGKGKKAVK